jgi:endo-1,4-beta-xylanase
MLAMVLGWVGCAPEEPGTTATGGTSAISGGTGTGGTKATGGTAAPGTGGRATGGNPTGGSATGGKATGGNATGGKATGGTATGGKATGGNATATGGAATGCPASTCTEADRTLTGNGTGKHCGYTYEYWKDQGTGSLVLKPNGYSVSWSNINNLLGRKGIRPGSANLSVTYEANYQPNGNSYLCIYGWTRNPLIEYYIVDSWGSWRPPGGTSLGTVTSDGGTYDIYRTQRVNQPSIDGTQTFYQYWSVRTAKRTSGTITCANHFSAWASKGLNMGSFYEVSMTVEGYQSSGTADVCMSIK